MNKEINTINLPLAGAESEHSALILDKGLSEIEGINTHKVELNNKRAVITTANELATIPKAVKVIRDLDYDADTLKKTFPVLNMTCASCTSSSQSILENTFGVVNVSINYANATAHVEYVPTITDAQKMKVAMQSIGYDLMIDESKEAKDELEEIHCKKLGSLKRRTIGSVALSIPLLLIGMFPCR